MTPHQGGVRDRTSQSQAHRGDAEIREGFITGAVICAPLFALLLPLFIRAFSLALSG